MQRSSEDLEGARKVEHVELGVQSNKDINGLVRNSGRLVHRHLAGWGWVGLGRWFEKGFELQAIGWEIRAKYEIWTGDVVSDELR